MTPPPSRNYPDVSSEEAFNQYQPMNYQYSHLKCKALTEKWVTFPNVSPNPFDKEMFERQVFNTFGNEGFLQFWSENSKEWKKSERCAVDLRNQSWKESWYSLPIVGKASDDIYTTEYKANL